MNLLTYVRGIENRLEHHLGRDKMSIGINELLQNDQNYEIYFG